MNLRRQLQHSRGFTLVEVLLAASVMLVGVIGMIHVVTSGAEMLDASRKQTIATQIMHGEIERIRLTGWEEIKALAIAHPTQQGYAETSAGRVVQWLSSGATVPPNTFQFSRTIGDAPSSDMKKVSYTVAWVSGTGRPYTRSTSTYVGKNGLYVAYQR